MISNKGDGHYTYTAWDIVISELMKERDKIRDHKGKYYVPDSYTDLLLARIEQTISHLQTIWQAD